ncbi:sepiapterin reductase [Entomortierella parvispora]|uniref:Sepiapterin reductase n=1 Tax=Entomortierella parvispora TaxID=205924 RepID=A0A9P3H0V0_9FUNG|nr:sepiapterin reductase [Entomortierella parvispora]
MTTEHHLVVITGANRGFGASAAHSYVAHSGAQKVSFVLVGRNQEGLQSVLDSLHSSKHQVQVKGTVVADVDLAQVDQLDENLLRIEEAISAIRADSLQSQVVTKSVLINNAGSLGDLSKTAKEFSWQETRAYMDFNVASFVGLTSTFIKGTQAAFPKEQFPNHKTVIVSISSLLAVQAFSNWGLYAAGKAARDRFLGVIALEEKDNNVKTLNYAPGPLDNEMQADVRRTLGDKEQLEIYDGMHKSGSLVKMDDSSRKLVLLLTKDTFESGAHIDFYDEEK